MSKKRPKPFAFLYSPDSDTETASEGEVDISNGNSQAKRVKACNDSSSQCDPEVEILKVIAGRTSRQVEIIKVKRPTEKTPEIEIVKVIPGTSSSSDENPWKMKWPIEC